MVAKTIDLPNVKRIFIPDPGYVICDSDLEQADAQVVAWEADDEELKQIFRDPALDLHTENAKTIFGHSRGRNRQSAKVGVHATNYGASARTVARALGITVHQAERFQNTWFAAHPKISEWHDSVSYSLQTTRSVRNKFGYWRYYFDRIEHLLPEALAWIPQSTVALVINRGWDNLATNIPEVEVLLQVHDSLVYQVPKARFPFLKPKIRECLEIEVPYDDPLVIPIGLKSSEVSWGDCSETSWEAPVLTLIKETA